MKSLLTFLLLALSLFTMKADSYTYTFKQYFTTPQAKTYEKLYDRPFPRAWGSFTLSGDEVRACTPFLPCNPLTSVQDLWLNGPLRSTLYVYVWDENPGDGLYLDPVSGAWLGGFFYSWDLFTGEVAQFNPGGVFPLSQEGALPGHWDVTYNP